MAENKISLENYITNRKKIISENTYNEIGISEPKNLFNVTDTAIAGTQGFAKGITYLMDFPQAISDISNFLTKKPARATVNFLRKNIGGYTDEEIDDINNKADEVIKKIESKKIRVEPGAALRKKFMVYEPTSKVGEYAEAATEFAAGGVLGKGAKAKAILMSTGALSGLTEQAVSDVSGSEGVGLGVGIGTNILLDILALRKGNLSGIAAELLPKQQVIDDAKKLQQYAQSKGITLTAGEATNKASIIATEGNIKNTLEGSKIMDDFYEMRPEKIKNFITKFGKENGIITDASKTSRTTMLNELKKSAIALTDNRTKLWEKAGGLKLKEFYFPQVEVDNIIAKIAKQQNNKINKEFSPILENYKSMLRASDAKGDNLHAIYRQIRDEIMAVSKNPNATSKLLKEKRLLQEIADDIDGLLLTNKDYATAQSKYKKYTKAYFEPINRVKIFKDIKTAGWIDDPDIVGKVYRFLGSDTINARDIEKLANSFAASGNKKQWRLLISGYFEQAFNKAQIDNLSEGLNMGSVLHKSIVGSPKARANFSEMIYQLAKQQGYNKSKTEIVKAIDSFAAVLKATARNAKAGSPTASRTQQYQNLSENAVSTVLGGQGGIPILQTIKNFFSKRTFSKNSEQLAKVLTSEKGIDELINLADNYRNYNAAVATVRSLTQLMDQE